MYQSKQASNSRSSA